MKFLLSFLLSVAAVGALAMTPSEKVQVEEQAKSAGVLSALMLACGIKPTTAQVDALEDYRNSVIALGREAKMEELDIDTLVDNNREAYLSKIPRPTPAPLCTAAVKRLEEIEKRFSLFRLTPPEVPDSPQADKAVP